MFLEVYERQKLMVQTEWPAVFEVKAKVKTTIFCPRAVRQVEDSCRGPHPWKQYQSQHDNTKLRLSVWSYAGDTGSAAGN